MSNARDIILDWAERGRVAPCDLRAALIAAGALPDGHRWRNFIDRMLLFMGAVLLGAGVIFFFAFNWQSLGRYAKFALVEVPILLALACVWKLGLERASGKAALLAAALFMGALLALIGQTYQTGADTCELFAAWAGAILPWALLARFPAFWILWLALVNLALSLYFVTFGLFWGVLFGPEKLFWLLFGLNTLALVVCEASIAAGIAWLHERWAMRVLAVASGTAITALAIFDVFDWNTSGRWGLPLWCAWLAAVHVVYRRRVKDVFVLAGGVLSLIIVIAAILGEVLRFGEADTFLLIGLVVIGMSAAGGWWLKQVANEDAA